MAATVYRFLPWTRRGLVAALPNDGAPDQRPELAVKVVVAGAGEVPTSVRLHGPGDVVGIDPNQVVRTYPRPYTTDAEPNYLAAVDLDAPELPWLFTPRGVPGSGHLPPWVVLVVVEDKPGVSLTVPAGAPLPQLRIESGAADELPDLTDSWAWAHVQLVEPSTATPSAQDVAIALAADPDRNVGRLVCPRRLAPRRRWIAALVPAFDVGRVRGLGGTPAPDAKVGPAWEPGQDTVTLPVYFHWEFQTGPEGDFESLAQRLKPHKAATTVGLVPMHVGEGAPPIQVPTDQNRHLDMDGALRAPAQSDGRLSDVPVALRAGLKEVTRTLADAADGVLDGQTLADASRQPVGPPVYASSHVRRWRVLDGEDPEDAEWFRELNLDPRARVAAGLGTECVRVNQEDIANAAWRQVGDVTAAEAALQRAALGALVSGSFFRRHVAPMPDEALLPLAGPMAPRTPFAGRSLTATIARTSLPDAVVDAGFRRALGPAGRAVARSARRLGVPIGAVRPGLVSALAKGRKDLDATRFPRPVLSGVRPDALTGGDLSAIGLPVQVAPEVLTRLAASARLLSAGPVEESKRLVIRDEVRTVGLIGQAHVEAARLLASQAAGTLAGAIASGARPDVPAVATVAAASMLDAMVAQSALALAATRAGGGGVGLLVEGPAFPAGAAALDVTAPPVAVGVLDLDAGNTLVVRTGAGQANIPVAVLDSNLSGADLGGVLSRLPVGVFRGGRSGVPVDRTTLPVVRAGGTVAVLPENVRPGNVRPGDALPLRRGGLSPVLRGPVTVGPRVVPDPVVVGPVRPTVPGDRPTIVVPPLIRDAQVISRFEAALTLQRNVTVIATPTPVATLVPYDLAAAATAIRTHVDPSVAQPLRRDALVAFAGRAIGALRGIGEEFTVDGWWATHALDRIMAYPTFPVAASDYLSSYDSTRFCPGVDTVPSDSVTLLETNPRFIAAFMAGLNHETNRELLWRGFPTDSRGTPFRHFWRRLDGKDDIPPIHGWRLGRLAEQTTDPKGNLVLLVRGDLLRRYPNTIVVAMPAAAERKPDHDKVVKPVFAGRFDPDVSFFGFPLVDSDLQQGRGWFFALMEPVTEPRFGLDETKGASSGGGVSTANALAWTDTDVPEGGHLGTETFGPLGLDPGTAGAGDVAATLFQRPFALYVHAKHLVDPLPVQQ
ncbi:hypothetical protein Pth03_26360 [Planotetraspora thailandica]|uniref:Uncharacterized protein n=1 Tax=Planotetraspora thailandica TaxID=487172 RepID=A0A8J3XTD9_9ACTN|nr:hypothetical protein [Planotetraspora thailandica]GII54247.1 hypothetical protein Pth03_26360 [Planotetraspora thailandica]